MEEVFIILLESDYLPMGAKNRLLRTSKMIYELRYRTLIWEQVNLEWWRYTDVESPIRLMNVTVNHDNIGPFWRLPANVRITGLRMSYAMYELTPIPAVRELIMDQYVPIHENMGVYYPNVEKISVVSCVPAELVLFPNLKHLTVQLKAETLISQLPPLDTLTICGCGEFWASREITVRNLTVDAYSSLRVENVVATNRVVLRHIGSEMMWIEGAKKLVLLDICLNRYYIPDDNNLVHLEINKFGNGILMGHFNKLRRLILTNPIDWCWYRIDSKYMPVLESMTVGGCGLRLRMGPLPSLRRLVIIGDFNEVIPWENLPNLEELIVDRYYTHFIYLRYMPKLRLCCIPRRYNYWRTLDVTASYKLWDLAKNRNSYTIIRQTDMKPISVLKPRAMEMSKWDAACLFARTLIGISEIGY